MHGKILLRYTVNVIPTIHIQCRCYILGPSSGQLKDYRLAVLQGWYKRTE